MNDSIIDPCTPIIVGVGQFTERLGSATYQGLSCPDIAAAAGRAALADASPLDLTANVDAIASVRNFEDSSPQYVHPFGKTDNFPWSVANRLGVVPKLAVWGKVGGTSPQVLIAEFFEKVAAGTVEMALIVGGENISTVRHVKASGETRDWAETVAGMVDNRGIGIAEIHTGYGIQHRIFGGPAGYSLLENARRKRLGMTRRTYALEMGRLFAPMTRVAAANPYTAADQSPMSADDLITLGDRNRMITDPYTQRLCSRDQVNMGAAVLITSVGKARALGIPEAKWVYLHGYNNVAERPLLERQNLGVAPACQLSASAALDAAGVSTDQVGYFDFYSCFPIAVFTVACDGLGLSPDDQRGLTVTGGLPYFGGPGANYSMHAVATMTEKLRGDPGSIGFIGANGGYASKYASGVYSTTPRPFVRCESRPLQRQIDDWDAPRIAHDADGAAVIDTYTIIYEKGVPAYAIVVGTLEANGERFFANTEAGDDESLREMLATDPLGRPIHVRHVPKGNRFAFNEARLDTLYPVRPPAFRDSADYQYCIVERRGRLLEVTINRPESFNCLTPPSNDEMEEIWDAYEADPDLWVAILTGAGEQAFSTGNDLKYTAAGNPWWIPRTGFGGLTNRTRTKPIIAAVNGFAMGGGAEISLACDIVVADENLKFALSEVRVGLIAGAGGLVRLPRQLPKKVAMEMILTGRRLGAEEALGHGLISRIAPVGKALEIAREVAEVILEGSPTSIRLSMQVINEANEHPSEIEALRHFSEKVHDEMRFSEDMVVGTRAFASKQKPAWKNR